MELQQIRPAYHPVIFNRSNDITDAEIIEEAPMTTKYRHKHFIEANTKEVSLSHLKDECIIPVFSKDNEVTISHTNFIEVVLEAAHRMFRNEAVSGPQIRVSHIIKGRTPEALYKPVKELTEADKTIYYERMMFCIEIPSIFDEIGGNRLNLAIGGVRAYNQENLYSRKTLERFKVFIGFKNLVCCNLCVSTDGLCGDIRASNTNDLMLKVMELIASYNVKAHIDLMKSFMNHSISESQFAQLIGKMRLYQNMPQQRKKLLPSMLMTDSQINLVARTYYHDSDFSVSGSSNELSMWNLYNLFTGANKVSYIDNFLDRSLNATEITVGICKALNKQGNYRWFLE